ncbi:hypothetical protein JRY29_22915 [Salmonella enterica subsp. enterica serovar Kentucky]|nr:hypothetical protein JRY29_22915 [Salmonella enterica subsp. enterica serovar Kentucky]
MFPLLLVLSATAFSASAMAASDSKPHQIIQNTPPVAGRQAEAFIHPEWCEHWPAGEMKPPGWCQVCGC